MTKQIWVLLMSSVFALAIVFALLWQDATPTNAAPNVATVRYVAASGTDAGNNCSSSASPCLTIQRAADVSSASDEIRVAAGTYNDVHPKPRMDVSGAGTITQVVYITQSLYVRGGFTTTNNYASQNIISNVTTLDAQNKGRAAYISGGISVTLEGFTLKNGDANLLYGDNTPADVGAGIYAISATVTLTGNKIINNGLAHLPMEGGGIYKNGGSLTLMNNLISNNSSAQDGAGLYLFQANANVISNVFSYNTSNIGWGGGAIFQVPNTVVINNNQFLYNSASGGGGVFLYNNSQTTLNGNIVRYNTATAAGGGVEIYFGAPLFTNNVIADNKNTSSNYGSGLAVFQARPTLKHTTIARNSGGDGSGIFADGSITLTHSIIFSHTLGITTTLGSTTTLDGVLWFNNASNFNGPGTYQITNQSTGNPAFAADGYHLTASSAAINQSVMSSVTTDIDGQTRDAQPDFGADEFLWLKMFLPLILR